MEIEIFDIENYKFISDLLEEKLAILRKNEDFNQKYKKLIDLIEELDKSLEKDEKEKFDKIIQLFYQTEEYYFILAYSLGVKYGDELNKI